MTENVVLIPYTKGEFEGMLSKIVSEALKGAEQVKEIQQVCEFERMTRQEAMAFLKVKDSKFNNLRREGLVIPQRDGNRTYYDKRQLINYCRSLECNKLKHNLSN